MAKKIYLSTFNIKVLDRREETVLNLFNNNEDFFDFFKDFADDVFKNVRKTHGYSDNTTLHLAFDEPVKHDKDLRVFYGYISSGVGGDRYKVRNSGETETKFESNPDSDITYRDLFFYLQLPIGQKFGYLILQKKRDFGVKGSIQKALNKYFQEKGYPGYRATINNMLNGRVFDKMMSNGNLKNIDFIKKSIPSTLDDLYLNGLKKDKGVLTTSIRSSTSLSGYWKDFIKQYYKKQYKENIIELNDGLENLDNLDEIEFEVELKGKKKTFHVLAKNRTLPDVEVSDDLDFIRNEPTTESLVKVADSLISDMLTLTPNVSTN
ncbi:MAG: hypothetical protein ABI367_00100 [Mucilaginibacter sp.]